MSFVQLRVVVWKNLIIRKRHWLLTIIESILPILLFVLIDYARHEIGGVGYSERSTTYTSPEPLNYHDDIFWIPNRNLYFAPDTEFNKDLMKRVQAKISPKRNDTVKAFPSSESLLEYYESRKDDSMIAVIFNGNEKNLDYTIRIPDEYYYKPELYRMSFEFSPNLGIPYFYRRFMVIQKALDVSFIEKVSGKEMESQVQIMTQEFPYPIKQTDMFFVIFSIFLPAATLFSFIFLCAAVLKRVVEEKYLGTKELLKMVGMKSWMLWLGWFIHGMIPILFSLVCIVVLMKVSAFNDESYSLVQRTDGLILFAFLLLYCMAATVFCFAFSSLFNRPTLAMMCGILVWILSYFVPKYGLSLDSTGYKFSWIVNILLNLLPNMTLHYGFLAISLYEQRGLGVQWNNFYKPATGGPEDVTMLNVFVMLIIDMIIYMSFTLYMDGVNPGKYGVRKSFLFPIYSLVKLIKKPGKIDYQGTEPLYLDHVEEGRGLSKGIELQDVVKRYGHKDAVNNLTLNIYRNQITVLLGHNGAGKSTTMSMITGMIDVTAGTIKINGKDISTDMDDIRKSLGLCPQHNLLFTDLTVGEHLLFFAKLKGQSNEEAEKEMLELLKILHLSEKKNSLASTLSGGMKRKLCIGMAIIGGSQVLILDEPTSGMDPESRRELWDLLLKWRGEKTILITTHFMEEADALGDWIAIMANGKLQCHGTPMYLKKEYDTGYHLSLIVSDDATENERNSIKNIIKQIELAELKDSNGNNMIFLLPLEENSQIANLLTFLEDNKERLKIENISVTVTTLEDVFLKVKLKNVIDAYDISGLEIQDKSSISSPIKLFFLRILALIIKKLQFFRRKIWIYLIVTTIALLLFIVTVYFTTNINSSDRSSEKLPMRLSIYRHTTAFYNGTDKYGVISKMKRNYKSLVETDDGEAFEVENVEQAIIDKGIDNIIFYNQHLIVSAGFESGATIEANALYNAIAYHSAPISLNLITNSLVKTYLGNNYSISTSNWPLRLTNKESYEELEQITIVLLWTILVPIAFVLVIGIFILFPHIELSTSFIQLQYMCGVKPIFYWLINYLTDLLLLLIISLVMVTIAILMTSYIGAKEYFILLLLFGLYGAANIPFAYLFSRKKSASGGYAAFVILNILFGIILTIVLIITEAVGSKHEENEEIRQTLIILFILLLPQVGLVKSLQEFFMMATNRHKSDGYAFCVARNLFAGTHRDCKDYLLQLRESMILMFFSGVIYLTLNILLDGYYVKKCTSIIFYQISKLWYRYVMHCDDSVSVYQRLNEFENEENCISLTAKNLQKTYSGRSVVKNISFILNERECLGILGVNGAGKTTTFRMLTRDEIADSGYLEITRRDKKSIPISQDEYLENLGYCPQMDALNFVLTGRQILTLMAKLRGLEDIEMVNKFLKLFELDQYADMPCGHYSGGNKRKLSLAVALIGYPKFVLLDEPTSGVDPSSRRKFWNLIRSFKENKDLSFILTSHSMVECEALCNNLKIMKDGRFEREGTISELKKEHGGFNIKLKLVNKSEQNNLTTEEAFSKGRHGNGSDEPDTVVMMNDTFDNVEELKAYFKDKYNGTVKDEHSGLVHFYVDDKSKKWSSLFREVERIKMRNQHLIEDYSISEASLEDIFLTVARSKSAEEEEPKKGRD